jgi:1-acyl-sn-glycerol-3-phosphate acyltransferase
MRAVYTFFGYYVTLLLFGFCGTCLSVVALLAGVTQDTDRTERFFQRLIHRHLAFFITWTTTFRLFSVGYHGLERLAPARGGLIVAANHPSLVDITCLLARLPSAICIFKPAIRRNPVLGAAARRAGYLANDAGHEGLRRVAEKVASGHTLVVFPEGTRTPPGAVLGPLRAGFTVIARRADVPVQLVHISLSRPVLGKAHPWWKPQPLPSRAEVTIGPRIRVAPGASTSAVTAWMEGWWRDPKTFPATACAGAAGVVMLDSPSHSA